jgi:hypothetical protein
MCVRSLPAGDLVWWDVVADAPVCGACHEGPRVEARSEGVAGGSAAKRHAHLRQVRADRVRAAHPKIGGLLLAISDEPQSTEAWAKGARGERVVGAALDRLAAKGCVVFHDRAIPGSKANIDHLVVSQRGVIAINAKNYTGRLECRDVGRWLRSDERLFVKGRDRTKLVSDARREADLVRRALAATIEVPVIPVLCFVGVEIGLLAKPFVIDDVRITWPKHLAATVFREGPLMPEGVNEVAVTLARAFPAA